MKPQSYRRESQPNVSVQINDEFKPESVMVSSSRDSFDSSFRLHSGKPHADTIPKQTLSRPYSLVAAADGKKESSNWVGHRDGLFETSFHPDSQSELSDRENSDEEGKEEVKEEEQGIEGVLQQFEDELLTPENARDLRMIAEAELELRSNHTASWLDTDRQYRSN